MKLYGAIEAGGTKFVLAIGDEDYSIIDKRVIPTTSPVETLNKVIEYFKEYKIQSIGLGSFGPIDLNENSETYGWLTTTPKIEWQMFDVVGYLKNELQVPIIATTDVNASCYGEYKFGIAKGTKSCLYYTIGTGIGAGAINNGSFISGLSHPEMGHMKLNRNSEDRFPGCCPFHGDCLEGMASGPALEKRTGKKGKDISSEDREWDYFVEYIAQAIHNASVMLDPEVIILGGGVMKRDYLLNRVRKLVLSYNSDYKKLPKIEDYICLASLNDEQGILGCLALAKEESLNV